MKILALVGVGYSFFVVVWFFSNFARNMGNVEAIWLLRNVAIFGSMVVAPYAACWLAQYISRTRSASRMALSVVAISALTSLVAYLPGLNPHQDGEFGILLFLGVIQSGFAVGACAYSAISR